AVARFVVPRLGEIGGNPEQTLRGVIERRCMDLTHLRPRRRQAEPEPLLEVAEVSARREGSAREDHRLDPVEQVLLENRRQVERYRGEGDVRGLPPAPLEPPHRSGTGGRRPQRRREAPRPRGGPPARHARPPPPRRAPPRRAGGRPPDGG